MGKSEKILQLCRENDIRMIDFKMVDLDGRFRHITIPVERFGRTYFLNMESVLTAPITDMRLLKKVIWFLFLIRTVR